MSAFNFVKALVGEHLSRTHFSQVPVPDHPAYSKGDLIFRCRGEEQLGNYITIYADFKGYKTWGISYLWNIEPTVPLLAGRPSIWNPRSDSFSNIRNFGEVRAWQVVDGVDEWIASDERIVSGLAPDVVRLVTEAAPSFFSSVNEVLRQRLFESKSAAVVSDASCASRTK